MTQPNRSLLSSIIPTLKTALRKAMPFVQTKFDWSVGIYVGDSPFTLKPSTQYPNPVLNAASVTDIRADFIADPFLFYEDGRWYMFAEVLDATAGKGVIAFATSADGFRWKYEQVVLAEDFHLSYPHVFKWQDTYYMLPETPQQNAVLLYKADKFPTQWSVEKTILEGLNYADPSAFYYDERWWMFVGVSSHDTLYLYYADTPAGPWTHHPSSPIVRGDTSIARPGGRVLVHNDRIYRFAQDCYLRYGHQLHAFEVTELTTTRYQERRVSDKPFLTPSGRGWNTHGTHQVDIQPLTDGRWIACVDGYRKKRSLG